MDQQLTNLARSAMPFAEVLGIDIVSADLTAVVGIVAWEPQRCTVGGVLHGGYLMAVADSVGALCASLHLPEGATTGTIESKTNFLRPCIGGSLTVTSTPVHAGRTTIVVQTDVTTGQDKLVTRTTQTQTIARSVP
ncbi:MAG: PaaI family thioesterase [Acidimicrobiia bacterium]|nr:PaaI family thioesterase [Acidimicrobiia bacterium]